MPISEFEDELHSYCPFGFPVSRKSWERFDVKEVIGTRDADEKIASTYLIRSLTDRFNKIRYRNTDYFHPVHAGQLISVSTIVDVLRYVIRLYSIEQNPGVIKRGIESIQNERGEFTVEQPAKSLVNLFPPQSVASKKVTEKKFLWKASGEKLNREECAMEKILLFLSMANPAFIPFRELFDDSDLRKQSPYVPMVECMEVFLNRQEPFELLGLPLFECLWEPIRNCPDSLEDQLNYMLEFWAEFLPLEFRERLSLSSDILKEEKRLRGLGPGPIQALQFGRHAYGMDWSYPEPERFSRDADWMSNVVLIAKSTYVWLDQLSKKYKRPINILSDIPDEELDRLSRWGFTGLWLIGLWERCTASQKIKQIMGNPEAVSSAYSLDDYNISRDLGGEAAYQNLADRAWKRGIRLASDMVPNHMGICSDWVMNHPDWFLQLDYPPFPWYEFTGDNLSSDERAVIQIEDGYWEHRDASVVFKRIDKHTGDVKYIYHGNDGTSMPWNDTAQLNFMIPEVREAVIKAILHVALKFPIIRFDAAMTLAKKHYQRLWFPQPGDGGAIPTRAEHGMSKADFDRVFPEEFWRQVVDRIAAEAPDTLLLAEAFWLMEGYFVRTLGMHRVYNSAFMNMLKMEENLKYRMTIKNVLEFSPEVLKRFVNFMNNPDERTAIEQFGKSDKYFGVSLLLVTMPGLPMFGHGQIEGFTEKYGMEYRKAYWDEQPDEHMVWRHEAQIFPLMKRRALFSGVDNFAFYDFCTQDNSVDENVFAYTNRSGDERAIIIYNNAFNDTSGWIHTSTGINVGSGEEKNLITKTLSAALELNTSNDCYYIFRDYATGFEHIRSGKQIAEGGMFAELCAYQYHAFLDFKEVYDVDNSWSELARNLKGKGVPSIETAFKEMYLAPVHDMLSEVLCADVFDVMLAKGKIPRVKLEKILSGMLSVVAGFAGSDEDVEPVVAAVLHEFDITLNLSQHIKESAVSEMMWDNVEPFLGLEDYPGFRRVAVVWSIIRGIGRLSLRGDKTDFLNLASLRMKEWLLKQVIAKSFLGDEADDEAANSDALLVEILTSHGHILTDVEKTDFAKAVNSLFEDPDVREFICVNDYEGVSWFKKEQMEELASALMYAAALQLLFDAKAGSEEMHTALERVEKFPTAAVRVGYDLKKTIMIILDDQVEISEDGLMKTSDKKSISPDTTEDSLS